MLFQLSYRCVDASENGLKEIANICFVSKLRLTAKLQKAQSAETSKKALGKELAEISEGLKAINAPSHIKFGSYPSKGMLL